jgi:hypothetical protein
MLLEEAARITDIRLFSEITTLSFLLSEEIWSYLERLLSLRMV